MKVLIVGANSYVGVNAEKFIKKAGAIVDTVDTLDGSWKDYDFSSYDTVYHVAGIAHDIKGNKNDSLYMDVNYRLTLDCAKKAKQSGVKQFVFMSSILIYNGVKTKVITSETEPSAKTVYANSKLLADKEVRALADEKFKVAVMRPPMIFGPSCKGNFPRLTSLADKMKIFPDYKNERSMCYIDNFCAAVTDVIINGKSGLFFPQNKEYFCTSDIVKTAAEVKGKKIRFTKIFNFLIKPACKISSSVNKMFSSYVIDKSLSAEFEGVITVDNETSIKASVVSE